MIVENTLNTILWLKNTSQHGAILDAAIILADEVKALRKK